MRVYLHAEAFTYSMKGRRLVGKNRSRLRISPLSLSKTYLAAQISEALQDELGSSRRATKTVMRWTGVSDTTSRAWLQGPTSPSGMHLIALAANSNPIVIILLRLTGHEDLEIGLKLREIETGLEQALELIRALRRPDD